MIAINGNINSDFFVENPEFLTIKIFREFREKEGDAEASKYMWTLYQIYHQLSQLRYLNEDQRIEELEKGYYGQKFDLRKNREVRDRFKEMIYTDVYKSYLFWREEVNQIDDALNSIKWRADQVKNKLELLKAKGVAMQSFYAISKELEAENSTQISAKGKVSLSAAESDPSFFG